MTNRLDAHEEDNYTLTEHLAELRIRLMRSFIAVFIFSAIAWGFSNQILDIVRLPIKEFLNDGGLVFTAPHHKFMAHVKVSLVAGIIMSCPVWIYQMWRFVEPGLYKKERKYGYYFMFVGSILFLTGVCFCYFLVMPTAYQVMMYFGGEVDKPMITIQEHLSLFTTFILLFGLAFEMPLFLAILGVVGVVNSGFLRRFRRYAIVLISVVAALFTPPDPMSMVLLMGPLLVLYEISILIVAFLEPKETVEA